jgi:hypothetical protein
MADSKLQVSWCGIDNTISGLLGYNLRDIAVVRHTKYPGSNLAEHDIGVVDFHDYRDLDSERLDTIKTAMQDAMNSKVMIYLLTVEANTDDIQKHDGLEAGVHYTYAINSPNLKILESAIRNPPTGVVFIDDVITEANLDDGRRSASDSGYYSSRVLSS